jgi:hypothetical protein
VEESERAQKYLAVNSPKYVNPFIYDDIKTIADHVHWAGDKGPHAGNNRSDAAGGGHAHAGLMIYLGGSFPEKYRGKLFMNNIHGQRINMDIPERKGSGFVAKHGEDFVNFNDKWSQVLNLLYDQDGSVYMIDWYDKNQCHHNNVDGHDRSNGRIFKITYGDTKTTRINLRQENDSKLVSYQLHKNDWYVRHSRRLLQERAAENKLSRSAVQELEKILSGKLDETRRLRALWTLHACNALGEASLLNLLNDGNEYMRAWAIQLLAESRNPSDAALKQFALLAEKDPSPFV